ncbi:MAG: hypothetical protein KGL43_28620, partial [Burkholderiales bacterium]|nr:hypothetical protein [Burkholderiales bacterium]
AAPVANAIQLTGTGSSTVRGIWLDWGNSTGDALIFKASGSGGGINFGATGNMELFGDSLLANGGGINLAVSAGSSLQLGFLSGNEATKLGATGANKGNAVTLTADSIITGSASAVTIDTTGAVTVQPTSNSFSGTLNWMPTNTSLPSTPSSLTIGKDGVSHTDTINIHSPQTVAGPISIYGGNIAINAGLNSSAPGSAILVKADNNITVGGSTTLQTGGGALTLWANDLGTAGYIQAGNGTSYLSGGGAITFGGGLNLATGYAYDPSGTVGGIQFGSVNNTSATTINAGSGAVTLRGQSGHASGTYQGIDWNNGGSISAGTVAITGLSNGGHGIELGAYDQGGANGNLTILASGGSAGQAAVSINGSATAGGTSSAAGYQATNVLVEVTGAGGISVNGTSTSTAYSGIRLAGTSNFLAPSGAINLNGGSAGIYDAGTLALGAQASTPVPTSAGAITVQGDSLNFGGTTTATTAGAIAFVPNGSGFNPGASFGTLTANSSGAGVTIGSSSNSGNISVGAGSISAAGAVQLLAPNGSAQVANAASISASTSAGNVTLRAGGVVAESGSITSAGSGGIALLAGSHVVDDGSAVTLNASAAGAPVVIASNDTGSSAGGDIQINYPLSITTNGGAITLGGGNLQGSSWALGSATDAGKAEGIALRGLTLTSNGGNISMMGESSLIGCSCVWGDMGITVGNAVAIDSGTGTISIQGIGRTTVTGDYSSAVILGSGSTATTITSAAVNTTAIRIVGDASAAGNGYWNQGLNFQGNTAISATGAGGGITLQGTRGSSGAWDISFATGSPASSPGATTNSILATSGPISITGASSGGNMMFSHMTLGSQAGTAVTTSSSNITLKSDNFNWYSPLPVNTTGTTSVIPYGTSFGENAATGWFSLNGSTGLTIGSSTNTYQVQANTPTSIAGPISLLAGGAGGSISVTSNLASTATGAPIMLQAGGNITVAGSTAITTHNGDVTLWSDSASPDGTGSGWIALGDNATINTSATGASTTQTTGGGNIVLGGGSNGTSVPTGPAMASTTGGIVIGSSNSNSGSFYSGGGNISLAAQSSANNMPALTVWQSGVFNSGAGTIALAGNSTGGEHGIELEFTSAVVAGTTRLISSGGSATQPAITLTGTTNASSTYFGIQLGDKANSANDTLVEATGAGGITINANGAAGSSQGANFNGTGILSASGPIVINSGASAIQTGIGVFQGLQPVTLGSCSTSLCSSSLVTTSSANITLTADRINLNGADSVNSTGTLTIQPASASFASAFSWPLANLRVTTGTSGITGLYLGKPGNTAAMTIASALDVNGPVDVWGGQITTNAAITAAGDVLLDADTGSQLATSGVGLTINGNVTSSGGNITLQGRGGSNASGNQHGVWVEANRQLQAGGSISITGLGGASTGNYNVGVEIDSGAVVGSTGGNVAVSASGGGSGSSPYDWGLVSSGTISAGGSGTVTVQGTGGATAAADNRGITLNAGSVIASNGGAIGVSGTSGAGTTSGGQGFTSAGQIGSAGSGPITVSGSGGVVGLELTGSAQIGVSGYTGAIDLRSDNLAIGSSTGIASTGALTIEPISAGATLGLGGGSGVYLTPGNFSSNFASTLASITVGNATAGNASVGAAISSASPLTLLSAGNITLSSGASITTTGAGEDIVLAASGAFVNNAGSAALAPSGRFIVYSNSPSTDNFGGLVSGNEALWGQSYATLAPAAVASGSRYVFANSGDAAITATTGNASKVYGQVADVSADITYSGTPLLSAATYGNVYLNTPIGQLLSVLPTASSVGSAATAGVAAGPYAIDAAGGTANAGFSLAYANTGLLTVTPLGLTVAGTTAANKTYDATTTAALAGGSLQGVINGDAVTLTQSGHFASANVGSGIAVTAGDTLGGSAAANYT